MDGDSRAINFVYNYSVYRRIRRRRVEEKEEGARIMALVRASRVVYDVTCPRDRRM